MFAGLWQELGEGFGKRWLLTVFSPALLFWGLSVFLYFEVQGWELMVAWWNSLLPEGQVMLLAGALAVVVFTAILLEQFTTPIARFFEGYWPGLFRGLTEWLRGRRRDDLTKKQRQFGQLKAKEVEGQASPAEIATVGQLDAELTYRPPHPDLAMPTALGDVLCAAEEYPRRRYGLDPVVTWPRIYPLLGETLKTALSVARGNMDTLLRVLVLSVLLAVVWGIWMAVAGHWLWSAVTVGGSVLVAWLAWTAAVQAAAIYGDLLRASFDLHRFDLYEALHWPLPEQLQDEKPTPPDQPDTVGQALSQFLHRGMGVADVVYEHPQGKEDKPEGQSKDEAE